MASPVADSYSCASGGVIAAGMMLNKRITIWGQSNAVGRADGTDISASPLSSDAGLAAYWAGTFDRVYIFNGTNYVKLNASNNKATAGQFGPEFGLAVRWMRETSSGNLYIEKEAEGGISITVFDPAGANYTAYKSRRIAANLWLSSAGLKVTDSGFVWIQGESDIGQTQSWYQTRLANLLSALQSDALITGTTKRLLFQMVTASSAYDANIDSAKTAIVASSQSNTLAPDMPPYMKADNLHQNGRGMVQAGYDIFEYAFNKTHIST